MPLSNWLHRICTVARSKPLTQTSPTATYHLFLLLPLLGYPPPSLFPPIRACSCLVLSDILGRLLQAGVALLVGPPGTKADSDESGPRSPLKDED